MKKIYKKGLALTAPDAGEDESKLETDQVHSLIYLSSGEKALIGQGFFCIVR
ncbi:MAG: hypothetical protein WAV59_07875 [Trichococcus flocculiformis]|jgi:hypothetical protein